MRTHTRCVLILALFICGVARAADKPFDPNRDPFKDLAAAEQQAKAEHKNILLDVGGNWCGWCLVLDKLLHTDADLQPLLEKNFVLVHVNFDTGHRNEAFLQHYPEAKGYPAWYVLSLNGKLLKAEDTSELETDHHLKAGYNKQALTEFLTRYAPR